MHADRVTVYPKDLILARRIRGERQPLYDVAAGGNDDDRRYHRDEFYEFNKHGFTPITMEQSLEMLRGKVTDKTIRLPKENFDDDYEVNYEVKSKKKSKKK